MILKLYLIIGLLYTAYVMQRYEKDEIFIEYPVLAHVVIIVIGVLLGPIEIALTIFDAVRRFIASKKTES